MARRNYLEEAPTQSSLEHFETEGGDVCCIKVTVARFPGVQSLEQVFDAFRFYLSNMEICITERQGRLTVREDNDTIDGEAYNTRIVSRKTDFLTTESNSVVFMHLFDKNQLGREPRAMIASDCVDEGELHLYQTSERVHKDISGAVMLTAQKMRKLDVSMDGGDSASHSDDSVVVTMHRAAFLKLHHPAFPVSPLTFQALGADIANWGDVMIKAVRETTLYGRG